MSNKGFLDFQFGLSRKSSRKAAQSSIPKQRKLSSVSRSFKPNMEEMRWVFDKFDTNTDGRLSCEEYKLAQSALYGGVPETEVVKTFQTIDSDGDGFIDFKEFSEMFNTGGGVQAKDIENAFRVFDTDGNGKISAEELSQVLKKLGESCSVKACQNMIKGVDSDGDGLIDIDEFMSMMASGKKLA